MNLVVDIGNTRLKYAFFIGKDRVEGGYEREKLFAELKKYDRKKEAMYVLLSGSGKIDDGIRSHLMSCADFWLEACPQIPLPVAIGYETPETLGIDRIAGCIGARQLFPGRDLLVIDSGTAITYNYMDKNGVFLGGNIAPGQDIRFRSLHLYTEKLPYIRARKGMTSYGKNTHDAIQCGVMKGVVFEVNGYIEEFMQQHGQGQVVVTGGNSEYLEHKLPASVCFEKYLGLYGLNEILEYNKKIN